MARMGSTTTVRARQMRRVLERWQRSGLTRTEFAKREGLAPATLSWWRYVFRHADEVDTGGERGVGRLPAGNAAQPPRQAAQFTEVKFAPAELGLGSGSVIEVVLRSGHRVRVPAGCDPVALREVVAVLEGGPSC